MKSSLTPDQAWPKIKHFCAYRERCHFEVKEKLFSMSLPKKEVESLLSKLIEAGYLSEERFATQFAGGHFRQKKWGKQKIVYALRQKRVNEIIIKIALKEIDGADYAASLHKLALAKWKNLKGEPYLSKQVKTRAYLLQKGYEARAIHQALTGIKTGEIE